MQLFDQSAFVQIKQTQGAATAHHHLGTVDATFSLHDGFEKFGSIELEAFNLLFEVGNVLINDFQGFSRLFTILYLDLHEQTPLLTLNGKLLSLLEGVLLLSADFNGSSNIEDSFLSISSGCRFFNKLRDFLRFLSLDIAVQQ